MSRFKLTRREVLTGASALAACARLSKPAEATPSLNTTMGRALLGGASRRVNIPFNSALQSGPSIGFIGDSITAFAGTRGFKQWLNYSLGSFFYTGPGAVQAIIGDCLTVQAATQYGNPVNYIGIRSQWWLSQVTPGSVWILAIGTNDISSTNATLAIMQAAYQAIISGITALGGIVVCCGLLQSTSNQVPGQALTKWTGFNAWLPSLANSTNVIVSTSAVNLYTPAQFSDGLHPNAEQAWFISQAIKSDILAQASIGAGIPLLYGATQGPNIIDTNNNFAGTGGTAGLGASGTVPTGWTVYCNTLGTSGGTSNGLTAVCQSTAVNILGVGSVPALQVDVSGTPTANGILSIQKTVSFAGLTNGKINAAQMIEGFCWEQMSGSVGANIAGINAKWFNVTYGADFDGVDDTNGNIVTPRSGVMRSLPKVVSGPATSGLVRINYNVISGTPVDFRIYLAQFGTRLCELTAYALPYNQSQPCGDGQFIAQGVQAPYLNGTIGGTNVLTALWSIWTGGGWTSATLVLALNGTTVATFTPTSANTNYTQTSPTSGSTYVLTETRTNSAGMVSSSSVTYMVP